MATATEAPASITAEGPTQHTQNQAARLTAYQLRMLHGGINKNRVQNLRGMSHLEAWDVRRQLIRIFGFGGFDIETLSLDLVHERSEVRRKKNKQGQEYGDPYTAWTIVYRAQVRLILKDANGQEIAHFDDGAAGDSVNQPSLGDAHDMGMKTAFSQALKRCAVNLGDQFGLSLYNDGDTEAVVGFSAAHPPQEWKQQPPPQPEPVDPPVRPEPGANADEPAIGRGDAPQEPVPAPASGSAATPADDDQDDQPTSDPVEDALLDKLVLQAAQNRSNPLVLRQVRGEAKTMGVLDRQVQGPPPERKWMPFHELLDLLDNGTKAAA